MKVPAHWKNALLPIALLMASTSGSSTLLAADAEDLTLEKIMADPDWIGNAPESPFWGVDSETVYYRQKLPGTAERALYRQALSAEKGGDQPIRISDDQLQNTDTANKVHSPDGKLGAYAYGGDIFLKEHDSGEIRQLTRSHEQESSPMFIGNNRVAWRVANSFRAIDLESGLIMDLLDVRAEEDPDDDKSENGYVDTQQERLFDYVRKQEADRKQAKSREQEKLDAASYDAPRPWYLGSKVNINSLKLSPNGRWAILGTVPKLSAAEEARRDSMPRFVTDDGYVEAADVRALVGTRQPVNESLYLLDLDSHEKFELATDNLTDIKKDPMYLFRKKAAQAKGERYKADNQPRPVAIFQWNANGGIEWSDDGSRVAIMLYSDDNKDRWIAGVDFDDKELTTLHHQQDEAWINDWRYNDFGFLPDNETLWYLSEEDGFSHLYLKPGNGRDRQLTRGRFTVSDVTVSEDGNTLYFKANQKHPGIYEIYRLALPDGKPEALTNLGGVNDYVLSPDEQKLLITHSRATRPPELYLQPIGGAPRQLTHTASPEFLSQDWAQPEYIEVPSSHADAPIYSRLYQPKTAASGKRPAVIFIHGAGYLQNAHQGWSGYFREFMFHTFLTRQGYVVLDMDYRASAGYGRDWRTAIYRQMGTPEVQDLLDGKRYLVQNLNVDENRVGIYGGSYGGFLTFMALFTSPDSFAAGAALRPVTDWAHYNHGYTGNILNTPELDPEAYERSSPIEFAEGLSKPLLICHGMVDDNVFFKDTVRLVQRLIELEKTEYFETALYPVEPHGFVQPSSWLDEYKRIYYLFEEHLK